ncbi:unnamed protein product [Lampetra fluviatilis]
MPQGSPLVLGTVLPFDSPALPCPPMPSGAKASDSYQRVGKGAAHATARSRHHRRNGRHERELWSAPLEWRSSPNVPTLTPEGLGERRERAPTRYRTTRDNATSTNR